MITNFKPFSDRKLKGLFEKPVATRILSNKHLYIYISAALISLSGSDPGEKLPCDWGSVHARILHCQPNIGCLLQVRLLFSSLFGFDTEEDIMSQAWLLPSQPEVAAEKGTKHNQGKIQPSLRFIFHPRPAAPVEFSLSPNFTMIFFKKRRATLCSAWQRGSDRRWVNTLCRVLGGTARPTAVRTSATLHQPHFPPHLSPCQECLTRWTAATRRGS